MFVTVQDFITSWNYESKATRRVLDALTDASLQQRIAPNHRPLGQLGWHIATTIPEMMSRTGLKLAHLEGGELAPSSAQAIAEAYTSAGQALLDAIAAQWTDASLIETNDMYGEPWANGLSLHFLIAHEIHHRGQMTVLMRQAGLRVPDFYGPAREDWLERGMVPLV